MKTLIIPLRYVSFLLVATLLGCSSTRSQITTGPEIGSDAAIESKLEMRDPRTIGEGAARRLELRLTNTSSERIEFLFTVDWSDVNGHPVPLSPRQWTRLEIDGGATHTVRVEPMPTAAAQYRLRYSPTKRD